MSLACSMAVPVPVHLLALALPVALAIKANVLLHSWLAVVGMLLLLRRGAIRGSWAAWCLASLPALGATGASLAGVSLGAILPALYLPLLIDCFVRTINTSRGRDVTFTALVLALMIYDGGVHIALGSIALLAVLAVSTGSRVGHLRTATLWALVCVGGCAYAGPAFVPIAALAGQATDGAGSSGAGLSRLRAMATDWSFYNADHPLRVISHAEALPAIVGDGRSTVFSTDVLPRRVVVRVVVGSQPSRIVLSQSADLGWSSTAGPIVPDPGSGHVSVLLPPGLAGRVVFNYSPRGFSAGLVLLAAVAGVTLATWKVSIGSPASLLLWLAESWQWIRARVSQETLELLLFLGCVIAVQLTLYAHAPYRPTRPNEGWENFFDQNQYLKSARALARADLHPSEHFYPIGYSLLATPFVYLTPQDPFFVVNTLCLTAFAGAFLTFFRREIGSIAAACAFFVALAFPLSIPPIPYGPGFAWPLPIWSQFVTPWSTIPIAAIYLCLLLLMTALGSSHDIRKDLYLGALGGVTLAIRPVDVIALIPVAAIYFSGLPKRGQALRRMGWALAGVCAVIVPVVALTLAIHGTLLSSYMTSNAGLSLSDVHERAYAILLDAGVTFGEVGTGLAELQPWLVPALLSCCVWAARNPQRGLLPTLMVSISLLTYLAYNDFWPFNVLRFALVHYIVWILPVVLGGALAGGGLIVRERRYVTAAVILGVSAGVACCRLEPFAVTSAVVSIAPQPAGSTEYGVSFASPTDVDAIDLVGAFTNDPIGLTQTTSRVVVDGASLKLYSGYRFIQLDGGVRLIFNRHVEANHISLEIPLNVANHPSSTDLVRAIRFSGTLAPFWRPKPVAKLS